MTTRFVLGFAIGLAVLTTSTLARADACIVAYEQTQTLRKDGKLVSAKAEAAICAKSECPAILARDCTKWLGELESSTPTVILDARNPEGAEVSDVRVKVDGAVVAEKIDGKAIPLDPGSRAFHFEADKGSTTVDKTFILKEGEKARRIVVTIGKAAPAVHTEPEPSADRPVPLGFWVFSGASVVALATTAVFAIDGFARKSDLDACNPHCASSDVNAMSARFTIADVGLGAGLLAGAAAIWLFVTRPSASASAAASNPFVLGTKF